LLGGLDAWIAAGHPVELVAIESAVSVAQSS
jgi:hypothetical protein